MAITRGQLEHTDEIQIQPRTKEMFLVPMTSELSEFEASISANETGTLDP